MAKGAKGVSRAMASGIWIGSELSGDYQSYARDVEQFLLLRSWKKE